MAVEKKQNSKAAASTLMEITGIAFLFGGLAAWSLPLAFAVTGVLLIIAGGLSA
jgi:hypothetical protein